jgi:hypothetical protein
LAACVFSVDTNRSGFFFDLALLSDSILFALKAIALTVEEVALALDKEGTPDDISEKASAQ